MAGTEKKWETVAGLTDIISDEATRYEEDWDDMDIMQLNDDSVNEAFKYFIEERYPDIEYEENDDVVLGECDPTEFIGLIEDYAINEKGDDRDEVFLQSCKILAEFYTSDSSLLAMFKENLEEYIDDDDADVDDFDIDFEFEEDDLSDDEDDTEDLDDED